MARRRPRDQSDLRRLPARNPFLESRLPAGLRRDAGGFSKRLPRGFSESAPCRPHPLRSLRDGAQIWPNEKENALVAVLLLAASAQFLLMAMTSYAMSAHLALNTIWLWLYSRPERRRFYLAPVVGVLAIGLHQPIVHALFVAPFLFRLGFRSENGARSRFMVIIYSVRLRRLVCLAGALSRHPIADTARSSGSSIPRCRDPTDGSSRSSSAGAASPLRFSCDPRDCAGFFRNGRSYRTPR